MSKQRKDLPIIDINKTPKDYDDNTIEFYEDETHYEQNRKRNRKILYFLSPWLVIFTIILLINIYMSSNHFGDIEKYADYYGVDKDLLTAIMYTENKFEINREIEARTIALVDPNVKDQDHVSDDLIKYYEDNEYSHLESEEINIIVNAWYLKHLLEVFNGNQQNAICAFDVGEETVNGWLNDIDVAPNGVDMLKIPSEETRQYIKNVNMASSIFDSLYKLKF